MATIDKSLAGLKAKRKGYRVEHEVELDLKRRGFELASKTKASLGPFDVLAEIIQNRNTSYDIEGLPITYEDLRKNNFIGVQAKFLRCYMHKKEACICIDYAKQKKIIPLVAHKILIKPNGMRRTLFYERTANFLWRLNSVANMELNKELKGRL